MAKITKSKEFVESVGCYVNKAYNHHSKDSYHSPFSKDDLDDQINRFLKRNPNIEIIQTTYISGTTYTHKMPVKVSKMLMMYKVEESEEQLKKGIWYKSKRFSKSFGIATEDGWGYGFDRNEDRTKSLIMDNPDDWEEVNDEEKEKTLGYRWKAK